jgi:hypothetical protein
LHTFPDFFSLYRKTSGGSPQQAPQQYQQPSYPQQASYPQPAYGAQPQQGAYQAPQQGECSCAVLQEKKK